MKAKFWLDFKRWSLIPTIGVRTRRDCIVIEWLCVSLWLDDTRYSRRWSSKYLSVVFSHTPTHISLPSLRIDFRDKAIFKISRNEVGDCTLELRRHILWIFPYWFSLFTCPIHFLECLDFIKAWCCERNIGTAVIFDPNGANKKMLIKYRQYKGEILNELKQ